jgi:hypothetical protein
MWNGRHVKGFRVLCQPLALNRPLAAADQSSSPPRPRLDPPAGEKRLDFSGSVMAGRQADDSRSGKLHSSSGREIANGIDENLD